MSAFQRSRRPTFFWQGLLIVLPVIVLSAVGLFSLRQDRILAQHEATEKAQAIADELAENIWTELTGTRDLTFPSFRVDRAGRLLFPPPFSSLPTPQPFNLLELSAEQRALWQSAQQMDQGGNIPSAVEAFRKFKDGSSPESLAAAACYQVGILSLEQSNRSAAAEALTFLLEKYPKAVGESGLRLGPLAQLKLIESASQTTNQSTATNIRAMLASLCSNAVVQPNPLSPLILRKAAGIARPLHLEETVQEWQSTWDNQNVGRQLYAAHRLVAGDVGGEMRKPPRLFWIRMPSSQEDTRGGTNFSPGSFRTFQDQGWEWLGTRFDNGTNGYSIVCRPTSSGRKEKLEEQLLASAETPERHHIVHSGLVDKNLIPTEVLREGHGRLRHPVRLPEYFGTSFYLGGNALITSNNLQTIVQGAGGKPAGIRWTPYVGPISSPPPILATATKVEDGVECLRCNVHLGSPQMLFVRQRQRTALFGLLIGVSAVAALVGFITARRAFYRQQHLVEMKSNFVSSVSHELRAPIASVRLMAEGLEGGRILEPAKQHEYFQFIVQECRRLSSMIENVLDFSRIEQGRKQYEFEPTDLRALVEQTTQLMITQAVERQIRLDTVVTGEPLTPEVDGRAIQQALVNLIDNALKHSSNSSIIRVGLEFPAQTLSTSSSRHESAHYSPAEDQSWLTPAATVLLWVEDSGEGIPPEEHARIFERFYRCGSELRRETQGVGIGLSIVKHIVEAHGGDIVVRSAVGQGSRFTLELPWQASKEQNPCRAS